MTKEIFKFFDKLEDKTRGRLSRSPFFYALIGGIGIILFWRGVWHTADMFLFMTGPVSALVGIVILLVTGVFVSSFIGNRLIMSGLKGEKKLSEKTADEVKNEETEIGRIERVLHKMEGDLEEIKEELEEKKN